MFGKDTDKALNASEDDTVYHNRTVALVILSDVCQIKALGHLKIKLYSSALPCSAERIFKMEVDLRTVERAVSLIYGIRLAVIFKRSAKRVCSHIPLLVAAHGIFRTRRQFKRIFESEYTVEVIYHTHYAENLTLDLIRSHEYMRVVLGKAAHAHKSVKRS